MKQISSTIYVIVLGILIAGCTNQPIVYNSSLYDRNSPNFKNPPKSVDVVEICSMADEDPIKIEKLASLECSLYNLIAVYYTQKSYDGCFISKPIQTSFFCMNADNHSIYKKYFIETSLYSNISEDRKRIIAKNQTEAFITVSNYLMLKKVDRRNYESDINRSINQYKAIRVAVNKKEGELPIYILQAYIYKLGVNNFVNTNKQILATADARRLYRVLITAYHTLAYPLE